MHISLKALTMLLAASMLANATPAPQQKNKDASTMDKVADASSAPKNVREDGTVDPTLGADGKKNDGSFCNGKTLRDGTQNKAGSCSPTVQGNIPSFDRMVSTLLISPKNGATLQVGQPFDIAVDVDNMQLGTFDNPQQQYYLTPQSLNADGKIIGHIHIVAQLIGANNNGDRALDARKFAFFKGLDQAPTDGGRRLSVAVATADGKPGLQEPGEYRICSITGQRNHAPVIMPVAQRGSQDDCIRITVGAGNGNADNNGQQKGNGADNGGPKANDGNNNGNNGGQKANDGAQKGNNNGNDGAQKAGNGGQKGNNNGGQKANDGNAGGKNNGGNNNNGAKQTRTVTSTIVATVTTCSNSGAAAQATQPPKQKNGNQ